MNNCEDINCEYLVMKNEKRVEYCWFYDTDCENVARCNMNKKFIDIQNDYDAFDGKEDNKC